MHKDDGTTPGKVQANSRTLVNSFDDFRLLMWASTAFWSRQQRATKLKYATLKWTRQCDSRRSSPQLVGLLMSMGVIQANMASLMSIRRTS